MADEDEIDVLGDFDLDNWKNDGSIYDSSSLVSQNTELLNCDYTIHPQWLLDKPSADPDNWYDSSPSAGLGETSSIDNENIGHVSTENSITDESGWTENEKTLLERGIDIFGKSNVRLSQFIGSKTASEVKYYLKNFYLENHEVKKLNEGDVVNTNLVADVLDDTQIPASIEEVIAAVSTAKPTVQTTSPKCRKKSSSNSSSSDSQLASYSSTSSGHSPNRISCTKKKINSPGKGVRQKLFNMFVKNGKLKTSPAKFKFQTKLKCASKEVKHRDFRGIAKPKIVKFMNEENKQVEYSKVNITTGRGLAVPISIGEEIVKLKNVENDSDSDIEVDVEMSDETNECSGLKADIQLNGNEDSSTQTAMDVSQIKNEKSSTVGEKLPVTKNQDSTKEIFDLSNLDEATVKLLTTLDEPISEYFLNENSLTDIEKVINSEYFEGKPSKTPSRYTTIRNHILKGWRTQKPNYLKKTSSRKGLKNCGDVNCFGRIHNFLEQIGAINFGCGQVQYFRPLSNLIQDQPAPREKKEVKHLSRSVGELGSRPRNKMKKFNNDGEGGCTLAHDEEGHVINTTVINEEPIVKPRLYVKKPTIRLIYARPFTEENPQPYRITINLSTLLVMDFHAHTSLTEVMGLVAGYWIPDTKTLEITHYEPCLNIASSATHCDMCPISQAKAADNIHGNGLDILGWFHSHPTFAPEPSQQDMDTQQVVQKWIGNSNPCIGVILSPFSLNGALIASPFRCMMVDIKTNFQDQFVPYKFKVETISENFVVLDFLKDMQRILQSNNVGSRVDFAKPYYQDHSITFLEKYITSVRMHLARCGTLNKMTCDSIINGITYICSNKPKS